MNADVVGFTILLVGIGLLAGKLIRMKVKFFSKYFLPSSVIGGLLFLLLGPEVLGRLWAFEYGVFTEPIYNVMGAMPGLLISVIFASLFLGNKIPSLKKIWLSAGPQISFGQTLAWGQYVFGILVTALVLVPFFDAPPIVGALIEIAFEGGHGTASGMADTFADLGYPEGADLALGLATVGVIGGVVIGVILINWGVRRNMTKHLDHSRTYSEAELNGVIEPENRKPSGMTTVSPQSIEPLALHVGFIGLAVLIGKGLLEGLILIENALWGAGGDLIILGYVPLFPMAMIGGVIVQVLLDKFDRYDLVDRGMVKGIQGLALDFLILSSIATLALSVIGQNIGIFAILSLVGIAWNVFVFMVLARRMIPRNWFERGIGDFGQSMGMTAIGLVLIRIVDSETKTEALEAFGYKQLLFEPLVGGGIVTALSVPFIYNFGMWVIFAFALLIMTGWLLIGLFYFGRKDANEIKLYDE
ncbi:MAG: sodium/glutamate symporter [Candidatus Izemoplasmataceae bacterium]